MATEDNKRNFPHEDVLTDFVDSVGDSCVVDDSVPSTIDSLPHTKIQPLRLGEQEEYHFNYSVLINMEEHELDHIANGLANDESGNLTLSSGHPVQIYSFRLDLSKDSGVKHLAKHLRRMYIDDSELDELLQDGALDRVTIIKNCLPRQKNDQMGLGLATCVGDIGEMLVSDILRDQNCWVPVYRYRDRENTNNSSQGVDVLGFQMIDIEKAQSDDQLWACEVKTHYARSRHGKTDLQGAIDDAAKGSDFVNNPVSEPQTRIGLALFTLYRKVRKDTSDQNGFKQKLQIVNRFINGSDHPYGLVQGAMEVMDSSLFNKGLTELCTAPNCLQNPKLWVIKVTSLKDLIERLYKEAPFV